MLKLKYNLLALAIFMTAGFVLSGNAHADCRADDVRVTTAGALFTCDRSHPELGEAWRDLDGLIWGDIVKNEDASVRYMVQSSEYMKKIGRPLPNGTLGAKEYCESIGAHLPSKKEFIRLRENMVSVVGGTKEGYLPQVLPNHDYIFWSSSVVPYYANEAPVFLGMYGFFVSIPLETHAAFRCVVSR